MFPSILQCKLLRQIVLSGLVDQVAIRVDSFEEFESAEEKKRWRKGYRCAELADPVFIHPSSVLFEELPKLVVYQEIIESSGKMSMRGTL
jgi:ATP-dependent RNA helicase DHX37/DHR1